MRMQRKAVKNFAAPNARSVNRILSTNRQPREDEPLCKRCNHHHLARPSCERCTTCGCFGHSATVFHAHTIPDRITDTSTSPSNQAALSARNVYKGKEPLCTRCKLHHPTHVPCKKCTCCGRLDHSTIYCHTKNRDMQDNRAPRRP